MTNLIKKKGQNICAREADKPTQGAEVTVEFSLRKKPKVVAPNALFKAQKHLKMTPKSFKLSHVITTLQLVAQNGSQRLKDVLKRL